MSSPVADGELPDLFVRFERYRHVVLAVSGGVDSTALMMLAARWRRLSNASATPALTVVSVDHGLRPESAAESLSVAEQAAALGLDCRLKRWGGPKPSSRIQERARTARYHLLAEAAHEIGADAIATAHTLDDQAETVSMRLLHGSSLDGLAAMSPERRRGDLVHLRPFLDIAKARLIATVEAAGIGWIEDPSNKNPRFERVRLREILASLSPLGLEAARLALLARRAGRASEAIESITAERFAATGRREEDAVILDGPMFAAQPAEIRLRLLGRAIGTLRPGDEGYGLRLDRLESLAAELDAAMRQNTGTWRRNLGGALVSLDKAGDIVIAPEPARQRGGKDSETKIKM